jgi:cell division protein FtsN
MKIRLLLLLFFTLIIAVPNHAQFSPQEEGLQLFENGRYSEALPIFKRLVILFPKDAKYQYYTGACMVLTNSELKTAIEYLTYASERPVPRDVYFFLGKAYHYSYRFDEALDAYLKFQQFGKRADKERWQCDMHINMARNGKKLLEKQFAFDVYKTDTISQGELFGYYNRLLKSGKFHEKKGRRSLFKEAKGQSTWCFVPALLGKDQPIYESSSRGSHKNKDLFQVLQLSDDDWSKPEKLGSAINTPFDEDYAFFNASESALYFASKGHNSMGGYDIFKSVFNPDSKSWAAPVNLGFPFNTPYDDFLFVTSDDQTRAYFASNRETSGDKLLVYTISFISKYPGTDLTPGIDFVAKAHLLALSKSLVHNVKPQQEDKIIEKEELSVLHSYPPELLNQSEYNISLNSALQYQLQSDSLSRVAEALRQRYQVSKSEAEKDQLKKDMYSLQQRSKAMQRKTDELYEKARSYEEMYSDRNERKDTSVPLQPLNRKDEEKSLKKTKQPAKVPKQPLIYEFKVMAKSPYTSVNQIPLNQPLPDGIIYRIQMGAFSKPIEPERFKGIIPIKGETSQNGTVTRYYAGQFSRMADAEKALNKVREYGFRDAYIVSFYNGKNIPINRAKELEKEN